MWLLIKYLPNRLTPLYFKIYYKKENYLKVKTVVFKYITPPYSKGLSILVLPYIFNGSEVVVVAVST